MSDDSSAAPPPEPSPPAAPLPRSLARKLVIGLVVVLLVVLLPVAGSLSAAWWMLVHPTGTAWLLQHAGTVKVSGAQGALLGDFQAERIEFDARPKGMHLVLAGVGWKGLRMVSGGSWSQWRVDIDELHATRVDFDLPPSDKPPPLPADLLLPLEIDVKQLRIDELRSNRLGATPLRSVQAHLHLGAQGGTLHLVDGLSLQREQLLASGSARIASKAPMLLSANMALTQAAAASAPAWNADLGFAGPLQTPTLKATLRALPGNGRPAQTLDAQATLTPFVAWPLGDLQASATALDLSAFSSAAPTTALTLQATARTQGMDQPAFVGITLANAAAGRWNEGRLPLRSLQVALRGRPNDTSTLDLQTFDAELGSAQQAAGRVQGGGRWSRTAWNLDATLKDLQPALLDTRAPAMQLDGPLKLAGRGFGEATLDNAQLDVKADIAGRLAQHGPLRAVQLAFDATLGQRAVVLREAVARAGGARATLSGKGERGAGDAPWQVAGKTALVDFDPLPWWPGREDSPWRKGPHKLNANGDFDLTLPRDTATAPLLERLAALRGSANIKLDNSLLAGVPLKGDITLRSADGGPMAASLLLDAAGNTLRADGKLNPAGPGTSDSWDLVIAAPSLDRLTPLSRLLQSSKAELAATGSLNATAHVDGRWPVLTTQGKLDAKTLRLAGVSVQRAEARWQMGTTMDAAIDAEATLTQASYNGPTIESATLTLKGTGRAHRLDLRAEAKALPPAWVDSVQPVATAASGASAAAARPAKAATPATRSLALLQMTGGVFDAAGSPVAGWRGNIGQLELRGNGNGNTTPPWARARDITAEVQWAGAPPRVVVQPGRLELLGAALRWSRAEWQAAASAAAPPRLDVQAELEPLLVAPLLARLQPDFGWGGDLSVGGYIKVRSAPTFSADVLLERSRGDLNVTDESDTQALELSDVRLALKANEGSWNFTQALAGKTLGQVAGAVVLRTSPQAAWPAADTPIDGVIALEVTNLGTWGTWVPAGWRLGGTLRSNAAIGGRFGAPEYTGTLRGSALSVRNFLQGVNVADGDVAIALQGSTARIEKFTARAGAGTVTLEGSASLGESPKAQLKLVADKFQLLGRVDRRIVASGSAQLQLDRSSAALDGQFGIDEGLVDFTRSDAPGLSDDVEVVRAKPVDAPASAPRANGGTPRRVAINLKVNLGDKLRLRGRGIDTGLRGELRVAAPNGRLALNGTVSASDGTYAAYGQKLIIDRGLIAFSGAADNPRLDIEATRPNTDVRVGVLITGTAQVPRIRLFSEPELSDIDKLSWLVLGRASDGLGRADTALLQRAAVALLSGEGEGITDQFTKAIGLDEVSLRQSDGDVRETVISLGKQLSRRWYVGYERGLNATTGTWQLIYRVAQRFTLRAQSGLDNSLDAIWTWRWQ
jgi:translocation and assembly module TamB